MGFFVIIGVIVILWLGGAYLVAEHYNRKLAAMSPLELATYAFGVVNEHLICPHCQSKGLVRVKQVVRVIQSTGKVGGILKTNTTSQTKAVVTQHHCDQCTTTWDI